MFVWTDDLAEIVLASGTGVNTRTQQLLSQWRAQPTAYRMPQDGDVLALAYEALGIPSNDQPVRPTEPCPCGALPASLAG